MSINGQGHSLTLVKGHSDFKVKCLNLGLYTQVSDSGPLGPLVTISRNYCQKFIPYLNEIPLLALYRVDQFYGLINYMHVKYIKENIYIYN